MCPTLAIAGVEVLTCRGSELGAFGLTINRADLLTATLALWGRGGLQRRTSNADRSAQSAPTQKPAPFPGVLDEHPAIQSRCGQRTTGWRV